MERSLYTVSFPLLNLLSQGKAFPVRGGLTWELLIGHSEVPSPLLYLQTKWLSENSRGTLRMCIPLPQTRLSTQGAIQQHKGLLTGPFSPDNHMPSTSKDTGLGRSPLGRDVMTEIWDSSKVTGKKGVWVGRSVPSLTPLSSQTLISALIYIHPPS